MKRHFGISLSLATLMLVSSHAISLAQSAPAQPGENVEPPSDKIDQLQKKLDERDALIRELIERVNKLEAKRASTKPVKAPATSAQQQPGNTGPLPPGQPQPQAAQQSSPSSQQTGPGVPKPAAPGQSQPQAAQQSSPSSQQTGPGVPKPGASAQSQPQVAQQSPPSSPQSTQQTPAESADAPGTFTVSAEAAQHALEIALVQQGAGLLSPWSVEVVPSLVYQHNQAPIVPGQIALSTTGTLLVTGQVIRQDMIQGSGLVRVGLPWDSQVEFSVPYDYKTLMNTSRVLTTGISQQGVNASGFGDPTLTLTKQLMSESEWLPNLFVSGSWDTNLGETYRRLPLGTGFNEFRIGLLASKRQDPLVFTAGFTYQKSLENRGVTPGDQFIPSVGMLFAVSPETSLQLSQQVAFVSGVRQNGLLIPGSDQVSGIFTVGLLSILRPGWVVNLSASIGETPDAPSLTVQLSLPIRLN